MYLGVTSRKRLTALYASISSRQRRRDLADGAGKATSRTSEVTPNGEAPPRFSSTDRTGTTPNCPTLTHLDTPSEDMQKSEYDSPPPTPLMAALAWLPGIRRDLGASTAKVLSPDDFAQAYFRNQSARAVAANSNKRNSLSRLYTSIRTWKTSRTST